MIGGINIIVYKITCKINNKIYIGQTNVTTLGMVTMRCQGKTKSPYKGYYFKYYEDYMKSQSTIESYIHQDDVENKVSNDTRSK